MIRSVPASGLDTKRHLCHNPTVIFLKSEAAMKQKTIEEKKNNFSLALGLFDYINPIFYSITSITIAKNMHGVMEKPVFVIYLIGVALSLIFGLTIPTVKAIVGLGIMEFKMPVNLVCYVNCGIFLSGIMLFYTVIKPNPVVFGIVLLVVLALLAAIYFKKRKFNTIAVLIGAVGYLLIYATMITYCLGVGRIPSVCLYAFAICLFVGLVCIGIFANLKDARVHWVIEISNVICQMSVAIATILAFR